MDYIPLSTSGLKQIRKCKSFSNGQKRKYDQSRNRVGGQDIAFRNYKIQNTNYNKLTNEDFCSSNGIADQDTIKKDPGVGPSIITSRNIPKDPDMSNDTRPTGEKLNFESKLEKRLRQHLKESQSKVCRLKSLYFGN